MATRTAANRPLRSRLKDRAYEGTQERVQESKFAPGYFLSERQLSSWLGMSKTFYQGSDRALLERDRALLERNRCRDEAWQGCTGGEIS
jgi:hypothetical protein